MIESITGNGYKLEIGYGLGNQRISQSLSSVNQYGQTTLLLNKHFISGLQEKIFYETGAEKTFSYISSPEGLTAIEVKSGTSTEWYTVFTDHLGSITTLIRESDGSRFELSYDAWGNRRNPATWVNYSGNLPDFITITDPDFITDRGFTGHEHLDMFGLINMNGRVYDPVASRFLSPDSFVQSPELALNYNGYVYCLNNPLKYTDPDGNIFGLAVAAWLLFTESSYEVQKYVSPVALHIDVKLGPHQTGFGFDASFGVPKVLLVSYRFNYGKTYYWETYGSHSGWETRKGGEWTLFGWVNYSGTTFSGVGYPRDQTVNTITLGGPFANVKYENDTYLGNFKLPGVPQGDPYSDGYRTAAARIKFGPLSVGMILHTGDSPSPTGMKQYQDTDGDGIADAWVMTGGDIQDESQSHGIFYVGFGPLRIGRDSEKIRNFFQNKVAHDGFNGGSRGSAYPWVTPFWDRDPRWYFQFGWGNGSTLY